jgi:hypothetical protein
MISALLGALKSCRAFVATRQKMRRNFLGREKVGAHFLQRAKNFKVFRAPQKMHGHFFCAQRKLRRIFYRAPKTSAAWSSLAQARPGHARPGQARARAHARARARSFETSRFGCTFAMRKSGRVRRVAKNRRQNRGQKSAAETNFHKLPFWRCFCVLGTYATQKKNGRRGALQL